jgi:molybdopterin molybdotransferase
VTLTEAARRGRHIRPKGLDFVAGSIVLSAPRRLTARDVGLLAAMNHAAVPVRRRPRVGVMSTGDEIVAPGSAVGPGQLVSANGPGLCAFVEAHGGETVPLGIAPDDPGVLRRLIEAAPAVDLLVTSGGVSVGDHDLVKRVLGDMGLDLAFHRIAMRPGKPLLFGTVRTATGPTPILGLPGNPVSAMICAILFLGPALAALQGLPGELPPLLPARLGAAVKANDAREDYLRSRLERAADGSLVATPFPVQDSGMVSALAAADALIPRLPFAPAAEAGATVGILLLDPPRP